MWSRTAAGAPRSTKISPASWARPAASICDRLGRRPALHPASRRPKGLCQNPRQEHHRVCRLQRQPAVHHARQSLGESQGAYFRDGLRPSPAREDLGRGTHGRRRPRTDEIADAARLQGAARTGHPVPDLSVGHQLPAAHPAEVRRRRRGSGARLARCPHRRTRSGAGRIEGPACCSDNQAACAAPAPRRIPDSTAASSGRHRR